MKSRNDGKIGMPRGRRHGFLFNGQKHVPSKLLSKYPRILRINKESIEVPRVLESSFSPEQCDAVINHLIRRGLLVSERNQVKWSEDVRQACLEHKERMTGLVRMMIEKEESIQFFPAADKIRYMKITYRKTCEQADMDLIYKELVDAENKVPEK